MPKNVMNLFYGLTLSAATAWSATALAKTATQEDVTQFVIPAAERMCGTFSNSGKRNFFEAKLAAEVGLKGLSKKLVDAKVGGLIQGNIDQYTNVLQKDLLQHNKNIQDCKTAVFNRLMDFIQAPAKAKTSQIAASEATQFTSLPPGTCGSSVYMYRDSLTSTVFTPQVIWRCTVSGRKKVTAGRTGLMPSEALVVDRNRGKIAVTEELTELYWGMLPTKFLSIKIKNTGPVTVKIESIKTLHASLRATAAWPNKIKMPFMLFPAEEVLVPAVDIAILAKGIRKEYDEEKYRYAVSSNSANNCQIPEGLLGRCSLTSSGFGLGIQYSDIFGDQYQLNKVTYLVVSEFVQAKPLPENVDT